MKILVFTNMYPFPEMPFYGSFVKDEADAVRAAGCEVDVLFINGAASKLNYFMSPFRFFARIGRKRYDIIHSHHSFCSFVACMQKRVPVVWTFHEGEISGGEEAARADAFVKRLAHSKRFKRMVARRVSAVVAVAGHFKEPLGRADAYTLPAGIDLTLFVPMDRNRARELLGLKREKVYVLFPSTPARPEKRYDLARAAVEKAGASVASVELLCLDNIPHERVPLYMNASNLVLMTSAFEASPVTIREALACNVPVVSTDVGDARVVLDTVGGCAIVPPEPDAIGQAIVECVRNVSRVEGRRVAERYSLPRTAEKLIEIYGEILGRTKGY